MITSPSETGVTTPDAFTVAMSTSEELHTPVGVVLESVIVFEFGKQTNDGPVIGATVGSAFTVSDVLLLADVTALYTVITPVDTVVVIVADIEVSLFTTNDATL
jgi:hypothetical protein